jgi:predicted dehydrogenase
MTRWGIIGTGSAARLFAEGLRCLPDAQLVAVASRGRDSGQAFAREWAVRRVYDRREDLVADRDVDVVYIATPHARHRDDCLLCLEADKPVLCEKPFTINAGQAAEVVALARRKKRFCMEAMWMRCLPLMIEVREWIRAGRIGQVKLLTADFGAPAPVDPGDRLFSLAMGGGALLDRGVYGLSLAHYLLGRPDQVTGQACMGPSGVDDQSAAVLRYPNGALAVVAASLTGWASNAACITATEGEIVLHEPFYRPEWLSIRHRPACVPRGREGGGLKARLRSLVKQNSVVRALRLHVGRYLPQLRSAGHDVFRPLKGNGYNYEAAEVMRCLREGRLESAMNPLDDTIDVMRTMDALRRQWNLTYPCERSEDLAPPWGG